MIETDCYYILQSLTHYRYSKSDKCFLIQVAEHKQQTQ